MTIEFIFRSSLLIIAAIINTFLALAVYRNNTRNATNRVYASLGLVIVLWMVSNYLSILPVLASHSLLLIRLSIFFATAMSALFCLFAITMPSYRRVLSGVRAIAFWTVTGSTMFLTLTPLVFKSVDLSHGTPNPIPGPGIAFFAAVSTIFSVLAVVILLRKRAASKGLAKQQFRLVIYGISTMLGLIIVTILLPVILFNFNGFVGYVPAYTIIFLGMTTIGIVRQRLFDIRSVVAKSVAYSLLITTMATLYGVAIFASTNLIFPNAKNSVAQSAIYTILAIILALTFQSLRRFFEQITDKVFFRDRYDPQTLLDNLSKILVSEIELDGMLCKSITQICSEMRIEFGQLIIFNNDRVYRVAHAGRLPDRLVVGPQLQLLNHAILVADELNGGEAKQIMDTHGIRFSAMLRTRDELIGYLLLGDKLSGETYSHGDIELLQIVAKELAVAAQNAKAYAEIQEFNITLQERVAHATNRLRVANRHLKELDQAKDEFISMASHQLRTPLTTIKGYLSMMLEGDAGEITPQQRAFTGYAFEGADRMVNLIADLLNVSRLSAGRFMIEAKPSDLGKIVEDEVRQLQSHAVAKNLELVYQAPKRVLPLIPLDDNKTRQVIMNFIDNAIYYTKEGKITVTVTKVEAAVRLTVRDTGIGVPLDARHKLFSKFYRAENAQTVRPDGTGLGLYLAKRVIEDQGGTIIFESVEGKGSTFGFELPLLAAPSRASIPKKVPTP